MWYYQFLTGAEAHLMKQEVIELIREQADTLVIVKDTFLRRKGNMHEFVLFIFNFCHVHRKEEGNDKKRKGENDLPDYHTEASQTRLRLNNSKWKCLSQL